MITKSFDFGFSDCVIKKESGQNIGIFRGLASTFETDLDGDRIARGAFKQAISRLINKGKSHVQMKFMHHRSEIIGGFPIIKLKETDDGLEVEGNVNLDVQRGKEAFSLIKQDVMTEMSIGFRIKKEFIDTEQEIRVISDLDLFEISVVDRPANTGAVITDVKNLKEINDIRDVESFLKGIGLSMNESKTLISKIKSANDRDDHNSDYKKEVQELNQSLKEYKKCLLKT